MTSEPGRIVDVEFRHDFVSMLLNCLDTYPHLCGRLFVRASFGYELENFRLP